MVRDIREVWVGTVSPASERSLLGFVGLALLELLGRLPEDVVLPVLSVASQTIKRSQVLSTGLAWGVVAAVIYQSIRYAYPAEVSLAEDNRDLRFVLTGFALAYAVGLAVIDDVYMVAVEMGIFATSVVVLVRYFDSRTEWDLRDPEGDAAKLLNGAVPGMADELRSELNHQGWRGTLGVGLWVVAFGIFLAVPCFVAGLAAVALINAFPVPDVLLLGFALANYGFVSVPEPVQNSLDLERRLYETIQAATRSVKGAILVVVTSLGGFFSAKFLSIALSQLPTAAWASSRAITSSNSEVWLIAWNLVGTTTVLVAAGLYGFWYWFRQFDRVPRFLELWEREPSGIAGATRPPWLTGPPTLGFVVVTAFFIAREAGVPFFRPIFAVAWPLIVFGLVGCAVWAIKTDPQLPTDEDFAVTAAISIQYVGVWFGATAEQIGAGRLSASAVVTLLFPIVAIAAIVYLPNVFDFGRDRNADREFASVAYLLGFGVVAGVAALLTQPYTLLLAALAGTCAVGAFAILIGKRLDA